MPRWHSGYKDPYFQPKNMFKRKPREEYASQTDMKLPEHLKPALERILNKPQPKFKKENYCVRMTRSAVSKDLRNFILSILPDRRTIDGTEVVYMVKRPRGYQGTFTLSDKTKSVILPMIFEAIEKGIF